MSRNNIGKSYKLLAVWALLAVVGLLFWFRPGFVWASHNSGQISDLQNQNSAAQSAVNNLVSQAGSYEEAISQLQAQIYDIQTKINDNKTKQADLQNQINQAEIELAAQRKILGESIKVMYVDGNISTIEMLASSKSLSEFVDKQQYQISMQRKITDTLKKINELKLQLTSQKDQVDRLLEMQSQQEGQLAVEQSKQNELLAYNQQQQAAYSQTIKANKAKISELQAAEAAVSRLLSSGSLVSQGWANAGDKIGRMGSTGYSTGVHVHFAAKNTGDAYINPLGFGWPAPRSGEWQISQEFGCTSFPGEAYDPSCATGLTHQGVDIWGSAGDPIVAVRSGNIVFNNCSTALPGYNRPGLGWLVIIQHPDGTSSIYAHMMTPSGQVYGNC